MENTTTELENKTRELEDMTRELEVSITTELCI